VRRDPEDDPVRRRVHDRGAVPQEPPRVPDEPLRGQRDEQRVGHAVRVRVGRVEAVRVVGRPVLEGRKRGRGEGKRRDDGHGHEAPTEPAPLARGVANQARTIRIPIHVLQLVRRYVAAERRLETALGRRAEVAEIAREITLPLSRAHRLRSLVHAIRTLDLDLGGEAYQGLIDTEATEPHPSIDEIVELQIRNRHLDELLKRLSGREEAILRLRYGFYDDKQHTLAETGEQFGLSRERIRQLEQRALLKLRQLIDAEPNETSASVH